MFSRFIFSLIASALLCSFAEAQTRPLILEGSTGEHVLFLQKSLNSINWPDAQIGEDSDFGGGTKTAVEAFQTANGITPVDGKVGTDTWPVVYKKLKQAFSTEGSTSYTPPAGTGKLIYLTFDDGPEPGTKEVLDVLKAKDVPATFFFVGEYAPLYESNNAGFLLELYRDKRFQLANHSDSQAHQFYSSYYDTGLRINAATKEPDARPASAHLRRSVLMDFEYGAVSLTSVLAGMKADRPSAYQHDFNGTFAAANLVGHSRLVAARLPGRNCWRVGSIDVNNTILSDARQEADKLKANGFKVYGWDMEWNMNFEFGALQRAEYTAGEDGIIDMYSDGHIDFARTTEEAQAVFTKTTTVSGKKDNKIIILLHDRAFRRYKTSDPTKYSAKLGLFIQKCLDAGYRFDVLKNY